MVRLFALAFAGMTAVGSIGQIPSLQAPAIQVPSLHRPSAATKAQVAQETAEQETAAGAETLTIYYSPLASTEVAKYLGLGKAYHMAIVYTDASGTSYGVSSGPSDHEAVQSPALALSALLESATNGPSPFGTLMSDPNNNRAFVVKGDTDFYTRDGSRTPYPHALVIRGRDLSKRWARIVATYQTIGALHLTYSPVSQNSNSLAGTALRQAGLALPFSSATMFTPGSFTTLPEG